MSRIMRDTTIRQLDEAEGYIMLNLPAKALEIIERRSDWATMQFEASFLKGDALRALNRYREALLPLEQAARLRPKSIGVAMALGWCYKRTQRLAQAIDALETAVRHNPDEPTAILHYNLACYWSLARNPSKAINELKLALALDESFRNHLVEESDFNPLRGNPEFDKLIPNPAFTL